MFSRVKTIIFNQGRIGSLKLRSRLEKTYPLFPAFREYNHLGTSPPKWKYNTGRISQPKCLEHLAKAMMHTNLNNTFLAQEFMPFSPTNQWRFEIVWFGKNQIRFLKIASIVFFLNSQKVADIGP